MFLNSEIKNLIYGVSSLLPEGTQVKSSALLRAFATFSALKSNDSGQSVCDKYRALCTQYADYKYGLISNLKTQSEENILSVQSLFSRYTLLTFLKFIVPGLAAQPEKLCDLSRKFFQNDLIKFAHSLIQIQLVLYKSKSNLTSDKASDTRSILYTCYCKLEPSATARLTENDFLELYKCSVLYPLNYPKVTGIMPQDRKQISNFVDVVKAKLMLTNEEQIDFLHDIIFKHIESPEASLVYLPSRFSKIKSADSQFINMLNSCLESALKVSPFELLSELNIAKRPQFNSGKASSEALIVRNDIPVSTGFLYNIFTSFLNPLNEPNQNIDVFFPSLFFFKRWINDSALSKINVNFIFQNQKICDLIEYNFSYESGFASPLSSSISLCSYSSWKEKICSRATPFSSVCLLFACSLPADIFSDFHNILGSFCSHKTEIFEFIPSRFLEINSSDNLFSAFSFHNIFILPQGINNTTLPAKKLFVHSTFHPEKAVTESNCTLFSCRLNTDFEAQAIAISRNVLNLKQSKLHKDTSILGHTIRAIFREEMLSRRSAGRTKAPPFSYDFSPEITIWYSCSYPKNNSGRPRIEAYICAPPTPEKLSHGCLSRGKAFAETRKHTTKIEAECIEEWLEYSYPFATVSPRRNGRQMQEGDAKSENIFSIRDFIIEKFSCIDNDIKPTISLKTFWYLFPNLSDGLSVNDYSELSDLMHTEIGFLPLQDISISGIESLLELEYPNANRDILWHKFKLVEYLVAFANEKNWCADNPLHAAVQDRSEQNKLFAQVRSALTKKHFTEYEMQSAYKLISEKIASGESEYLGLMIRLLTGLESNIVCALRFSDLKKINDLNIYQFTITQQLTNNGKILKGFSDLEDYRLVPCVSILQELINCCYERLKVLYPDADILSFPLVGTSQVSSDLGRRNEFYPPQKLDNLYNKFLKELGIGNNIILLPGADGGSIETNLNRYSGDFLRENFKFYALNTARLNPDELAYLLGNKPETTLGRHYIDFSNPFSQYMIFVKLERLSYVLSPKGHLKGRHKEIKNFNFPITISPFEGAQSTQLLADFTLQKGSGHLQLEVNSKNGLKTFLSEIVDVEE